MTRKVAWPRELLLFLSSSSSLLSPHSVRAPLLLFFPGKQHIGRKKSQQPPGLFRRKGLLPLSIVPPPPWFRRPVVTGVAVPCVLLTCFAAAASDSSVVCTVWATLLPTATTSKVLAGQRSCPLCHPLPPPPPPIFLPLPLRGLFLYCVLSVSFFFSFVFALFFVFLIENSSPPSHHHHHHNSSATLFICLVDREGMTKGRRNIGHLCVCVLGEKTSACFLFWEGKCHEIFRFLSRDELAFFFFLSFVVGP